MKIDWDSLEGKLDRKLSRVLCHPVFLQSVSAVLNANSHRKIWMDQTLLRVWKLAQLPNKRDQERTLHLLNELRLRIQDLESRMEPESGSSGVIGAAGKGAGTGAGTGEGTGGGVRARRRSAKAQPENVAIQ